MKVYHVRGVRHCTVVFAETPEMAIAQAVEQESVGDWEMPQAIEPPKDYQIIYSPK